MFTEDDFLYFKKLMESESADDRVGAFAHFMSRPSGDSRVLPLIEAALEDNTVVRVWIPITYGEIRVIAARALAAERAAQGINELVKMNGMPAPLHTDALSELEVEHGVEFETHCSGEESGIKRYCNVRDLGLVPKITWENEIWEMEMAKYK